MNSEQLLDTNLVGQECGDADSFLEIENCLKITSAVMKCSRPPPSETCNFTESPPDKSGDEDRENTSSFTKMKSSPSPGAEVLSSVGLVRKKCPSKFETNATSFAENSSEGLFAPTDDSCPKESLDFIAATVDANPNSRVGPFLNATDLVPDESYVAGTFSVVHSDTVESSRRESTNYRVSESEAICPEVLGPKRELPSFSEIRSFDDASEYSKINRVASVISGQSEERSATSAVAKEFFEFTDSSGSTASEEKSDNSFVSELISSENVGDFLDDIYDAGYASRADDARTSLKDFIVNSASLKDFEAAATCADVERSRNLFVENWNRTSVCSIDFESLGLRPCSVPQLVTAGTAMKSNLKRSNSETDKEYSTLCKKSKKGIKFDSVSVYYFPRTQGFTCIPSQVNIIIIIIIISHSPKNVKN